MRNANSLLILLSLLLNIYFSVEAYSSIGILLGSCVCAWLYACKSHGRQHNGYGVATVIARNLILALL